MKQFKENFTPIEIEITDIEGVQHKILSRFVKSSEVNKLESIVNNKSLLETDKAFEVLECAFGKDRKFWGKFSMDLLLEVANYVQEEKTKPKKK
jgi:plasmid maintenance system antidote protein VapI